MNSEERHERRYQRRKAKRMKKAATVCGKTFDEVFTFENLLDAARGCCKGVRWKASTIHFETHLVRETQKLYDALHNDTYKFKGFKHFNTVEHGKLRSINALTIQDRTVQKCFCDQIMTEAYSRSFIYDNSASLPGKGMDMTLRRLKSHLQKHYRKHGLNGGIYQFDFKNYFGSIPHEHAKERLKEHLWDERLQKLGCQLIDDFREMSDVITIDGQSCGVGLGSQVSQNIALDYASPVDHFIKDVLGFKHYARYMDDGYVICESIDKLKELHRRLTEFTKSIGMELNEKKCKITPLKSHSFRFLKLRIRLEENGKVTMKLSRQSIRAIRRKLHIFRGWMDAGKFGTDDCFASYQSWRAHARRCNSYRTLHSTDKLFCFIFAKELSEYRLAFKCTLRGTWHNEFGWVYSDSKQNLTDKIRQLQSEKTESFIPVIKRNGCRPRSRRAKAYDKLREIRRNYNTGEQYETI